MQIYKQKIHFEPVVITLETASELEALKTCMWIVGKNALSALGVTGVTQNSVQFAQSTWKQLSEET